MTGLQMWPDDESSTQVGEEQTQQRERLQEDIQSAWDEIMSSLKREDWVDNDDQIKLLKWALGVK